MRSVPKFTVRQADWKRDGAALKHVRETVFIVEQRVPAALEWDDFDTASEHALAEADGSPIGTGRLLPDGHIGRLAVLAEWRGRGVGTAMFELLLSLARQRGLRRIQLNAQTRALEFYARFGFRAEGLEFDDAGILHRRMTLELG